MREHLFPKKLLDQCEGTLFADFITDSLSQAHVDDAADRVKRIMKEVARHEDHRLVVLAGALLIESAVNDFLAVALPRFDRLGDNRDLTFALRIELARATSLLPPFLFTGADIIRRIRNEFAHNLAVERFRNLKPPLVQAMGNLLSQYGERSVKGIPHKRVFVGLVNMTAIGIVFYTAQVKRYMEFIYTDEFRQVFTEFGRRKEAEEKQSGSNKEQPN